MNKNKFLGSSVQIKQVEIFDSSAWVEFRGIPKNLGLNKTTHFAKIQDRTGKLHSCYVKLLHLGTPSLLCEALGWIIAGSSGVPCTSFACIVLIPVNELKKNMQLPDWTNGFDFYPAWCTSIVDGKSLAQLHKWEYWIYSKKIFKNQDVSQIAAMDIWVNNQDRNTGNVIKSKSGSYIAIDHEAILHDLLWTPTGYAFQERSLLNVAKTQLAQAELNNFYIEIGLAGKLHEDGYKLAKNSIQDIIFKILGQANADAINLPIDEFLKERSIQGWLSDKLGVIV